MIAMKAKDQRGNLSPSRGEAMEEEAQGGEPLLFSLGGTRVPSGGESSLVAIFIISALSMTRREQFTLGAEGMYQ